jgi:hypothetical protein
MNKRNNEEWLNILNSCNIIWTRRFKIFSYFSLYNSSVHAVHCQVPSIICSLFAMHIRVNKYTASYQNFDAMHEEVEPTLSYVLHHRQVRDAADSTNTENTNAPSCFETIVIHLEYWKSSDSGIMSFFSQTRERHRGQVNRTFKDHQL